MSRSMQPEGHVISETIWGWDGSYGGGAERPSNASLLIASIDNSTRSFPSLHD
jgi:hypothetical protein